jgi:Uma2 family endonuclease
VRHRRWAGGPSSVSLSAHQPTGSEIIYPDSDGQPIAENTLQFDWIVKIKGYLDVLFRNDPEVFVAADLLWYPVEGDPGTRTAPDAMVALGRFKGHRGSYKQWIEGGVAPQVVFEVLPSGNRPSELEVKFQFYERFGVEEYYQYDPEEVIFRGWNRIGDRLLEVTPAIGFASPRLGVRFEIRDECTALRLIGPDGEALPTYAELVLEVEALRQELTSFRNEVEWLKSDTEWLKRETEWLKSEIE